MLKIEISDPHNLPKRVLIDTATYLMKLAGAELLPKPIGPAGPIVTEVIDEPPLISPPPSDPVTIFAPASATIPVSAFKDPDLMPRPVKNGVELDVNGLPWDARIHSRTKSKNANGTWKLQRGVDLKKVDEISQTLKATIDLPPVDTTAPAEGMDFGGLMKKITGLIQQGKLDKAKVAEAVKSVGIPSLPLLPTRPDLIPAVSLYIDNLV